MPEQLEFIWDSMEEVTLSPNDGLSLVPALLLADRKSLAAAFEQRLSHLAPQPIQVSITDNTSTLISVKPANCRNFLQLRLHHMFLHAPPSVLEALAAWSLNPRRTKQGALIDAFIQENRHRIRRKATEAFKGRSEGSVHDLGQFFRELNQQHFGNSLSTTISWGKLPHQRRRHSIRFGSYYHEHQQIRIHPLLDQPFVPCYFVRYIVYHEMLHAYLGIEESDSGRRRIHTKRFNQLEQAYPDYARAIAWMESPKHLNRLLRNPSSKNILALGGR